MITVYLCCLIFGGILLIVSLFADSDSELGGEVEIEADAELDVETEGLVNVFKFLSFRNIVYFLAFFGLTGVTVSRIDLPPGGTLISAIIMGSFAAFLGHVVMQYLKNSQVGEGSNLENLVGQFGKVILDVSRMKAGKISIRLNENIHQILAKVADESSIQEFKNGDTVTIVRVQDGYAFIAEKNFIE